MAVRGASRRSVALITGASGGIGADLARVFARHGHDLALVARNVAKLDALASELSRDGQRRPIVIACDLSRWDATDRVASALAREDADVAILVNNAGFGLLGQVAALDARSQLEIVDLNVRSLLDLTLRFLPELQAARGRILNVASVASFVPGPGMAVYYASKAFVRSLSRALTEELKASGIHVSVLHPGVTSTGFHARAGVKTTAGAKTSPGAPSMSVAEAGYDGLMKRRRTIVPGVGNTISTLLLPMIPDSVLLPIVYRFQRGRV